MYINTTINCGFLHQFNNEAQINELIALMKKNQEAKFHFELQHLGNPSQYFDFEIYEVDDGDYGYYNYITFAINGTEMFRWDRYDDVPWDAIWSKLYSVLVVLQPV